MMMCAGFGVWVNRYSPCPKLFGTGASKGDGGSTILLKFSLIYLKLTKLTMPGVCGVFESN